MRFTEDRVSCVYGKLTESTCETFRHLKCKECQNCKIGIENKWIPNLIIKKKKKEIKIFTATSQPLTEVSQIISTGHCFYCGNQINIGRFYCNKDCRRLMLNKRKREKRQIEKENK